jgi:hypothetical protein
MKAIHRETIMEEIAEALALGELGTTSRGYRIDRTPDGSLLLDYQEADVLFVVSVETRRRP